MSLPKNSISKIYLFCKVGRLFLRLFIFSREVVDFPLQSRVFTLYALNFLPKMAFVLLL